MKKISVILVLLLFHSIFISAQDIQKDQQEIKKVIQESYIDGLINYGNIEAVKHGFHEGFKLLGMGQGNTLWEHPIYNWISDVEIKKSKGEIPRKEEESVSINFKYVDISGTAASAKIEFLVGEKLTYIDYLSLYKFPDGWKIVSKIFYKIPDEEN